MFTGVFEIKFYTQTMAKLTPISPVCLCFWQSVQSPGEGTVVRTVSEGTSSVARLRNELPDLFYFYLWMFYLAGTETIAH